MKKNQDHTPPEAAAGPDPELKDHLDRISREQPLPASGTELILLEVDPHRAHAYWNIDPRQAHTGDPLVLRVSDITESGRSDQPSQVFDVEVSGLQGRWYLDLWRDDRTFLSEIGYRQTDGSLAVLARSNEVRTPVASPEENASSGKHTDPLGAPLHTDWPGDAPAPVAAAAPAVSAPEAAAPDLAAPVEEAPAAPAAAPAVPPEVAEPVTLLDPSFPLPAWPATAARLAALEPEPEAAPSDAAVAAGDAAIAFADAIMNGPADAEAGLFADSPEVAPDAPAPGSDPTAAPELEPEFPAAEELAASLRENHAALQAYYEAAAEHPHESWTEAAPSPEPAGAAAVPAPAPAAAPARSPDLVPAPEGLAPLEQIVGLSSLENNRKDVLLEVNAELHIYGRSTPNTELTLYGQVVRTRPDGTFSVRRPLPHGALVLPMLYTRGAP